MQSEIEREEVILYPHVLEKLKEAGIRYYSGHRPDRND
jgi:L-rhamnose mutarotase